MNPCLRYRRKMGLLVSILSLSCCSNFQKSWNSFFFLKVGKLTMRWSCSQWKQQGCGGIWWDRSFDGWGLPRWPFAPLWWWGCPWWWWDLVFWWRSRLAGRSRPCWDVAEGAEASSRLTLVSVSFGVLELRDGMLFSKPTPCEWLGYASCRLPWRFPGVMEVCSSRGCPLDLSWVLFMITQSK